MASIKTHPAMMDEVLSTVNYSDDVKQALRACLHLPYLREYMMMAVDDNWTTLDVQGTKINNYSYHRSMAGAFMLNRQTFNVISEVIMKESVSTHAKLNQFKALSEMLYEDESKILRAMLEKNIVQLYPNLTHEVICSALEF